MTKRKKSPTTPFSIYLHKRLEQINKNLYQVSKESDINHTSMHRWFYGEQLLPVKAIPTIARVLEVKPTELLVALLRQEWENNPANDIYEAETVLEVFNLQSNYEVTEDDLEALLRLQKDLCKPMTLAFMLEFLRLRKS